MPYLIAALAATVVAIAALTAALIVTVRHNAVLRNEIRRLRNIVTTPATTPTVPTLPIPADQSAQATQGQTSPDLTLFLDMDRRINEEMLFKKHGFGREDICRLTGLSKERVGQLIKQFCKDGNLQTYVNRKRIAYAEQLMQENKNFSMEAIAIECGIGNLSTFYRLFKQTYGMAPAEYRQNLS